MINLTVMTRYNSITTRVSTRCHSSLADSDYSQHNNMLAGIGTYDIGNGSVNKGFLGSIRSALSKSIDQGFGTSFDHHVMAGYKFLMNH